MALVDGSGSQAPETAKGLADLQYDVALFGDSDRPLQPDEAALRTAGVSVVLWADGVALEQRIALDLPWAGVVEVLILAGEHWGEQQVRDAVASKMAAGAPALPGGIDPKTWFSDRGDESALRRAVGLAAKEYHSGKGWFKRVDLAEELAAVVIRHWMSLDGKDLRRKIDALRTWAHG